MTEKTPEIDWTTFPDMFGETGEVSRAFEGIRSADPATRRASYEELADRVVSQGSRSPAAVPAAALLIGVVADTRAPDRFAACQVLAQIAIGDEEYWLNEVPDIAALRETPAPQPTRTPEEREQEQLDWVDAAADDDEREARALRVLFGTDEEKHDELVLNLEAYDAVRAGVPVLATTLTDDDKAVRLWTAYLLAWFPEEHDLIIPALTRVIAGDPEPFVAAAASVAAGLVAGRPDQALIRALASRLTSENLAERWSAAIGLARVVPEPGQSVLEELYAAMLDAPGPVPYWPFLEGDISTMSALTIARLGPATVPGRVEILGRRLTSLRPGTDRFTLLGALLDAAFPGGWSGTSLTGPQQVAIGALIEAEIWRDDPVAGELLTHFGLPFDGPGLRRFLDG